MVGTFTPHQCCVLLQLQLYSHQFWPQNTFKMACRIVLLLSSRNSMNQDCNLTLPLPWPYVFLFYFSFKQTITIFERKEIFELLLASRVYSNFSFLLPFISPIYFDLDFDFVWVLSSYFLLLVTSALSFYYCCKWIFDGWTRPVHLHNGIKSSNFNWFFY